MSTKKEVIVNGFVRKYFNFQHISDDIIKLLIKWLSFMDSWDKIHSDDILIFTKEEDTSNNSNEITLWVEKKEKSYTQHKAFGIDIVWAVLKYGNLK